METVLIAAGVIIVATAVTWVGSAWLERGADDLAVHYRLPDVVQGTIVVAIGSSFPELSTTVISTAIHGEFELGMSAIVGSAIFNILVIPALSGISGGRLAGSRQLVYKDALFYLTSVAVLLLAFSFALIYNPLPDGELVGRLDRPIAACPLLLYGVYIFLQQQETEEHWQEERTGSAPSISVMKSWLLVLAGLVLIVAGVEGLIRSVIALGETLGTPTFLWGATVVAAATSLPDAFISIRTARQGDTDVSLGNVLGSNIFDLLVAIPAGVLIAGATLVDYGVAAPLMAVLTVATIVLFAALRTDLTLTRRECYVLLALYAAFIGWLVLETIGVTAWVR
ncbi:MAG: sodium:calcium antiporter [Gemmatimonadetes bacterium]|uniref:Sodium:calcium antiporter n=1 Tax=Candidatus Kutchimonas denitrificans TaxID=3056748 RepID=A0AAE4ZD72_9BACT|nr:sodium:calcium antiporter [Gemmatimonadota bacterium]NIR75985.1 sodium:calcium antiporter [Candidatus Kutchimonas denitrificans]NIS02177.1 sodium:calcium antiporter [Gemmatimonadota bacterium]NIT68003.1 sodium:calcium antiporter [Gemmatimonadota bacterium]NIU54029.1 sodium:calcium antiporter [Gemmatimonadota bacterium]